MKSALVTGAGSFIGSELVRGLTKHRVSTHILVRPGSDTKRLEGLSVPPQIHVTDGSGASISNILDQVSPQIVFHFAGVYSREEKAEDIPNLIQSNIEFATQLLDAICRVNKRNRNIKGVINTGSYFQYFDSSTTALNLYAATKNAFEQIATYYSERFTLPITTLVLFDIFGPRDWRTKLLPVILDAQFSGTILDLPRNDLLLNFVHSDDAVECFITAAEQLIMGVTETNLHNYAVRNDKDFKISEIIELFEKFGPEPLQTNWGKWNAPEREITLPWKGPRLPGWQPKISLEDGVCQLIRGKMGES